MCFEHFQRKPECQKLEVTVQPSCQPQALTRVKTFPLCVKAKPGFPPPPQHPGVYKGISYIALLCWGFTQLEAKLV